MSEPRKYNIEHRKSRKTIMIYDDQTTWLERNMPPGMKSESEWICHLLSLGILAYQRDALEAEETYGQAPGLADAAEGMRAANHIIGGQNDVHPRD